MLDLEAAVDLDERRRPVGAEQELEGPGVDVAELAAGPLDRGLHRLARLGRERHRRRLLDELLVAALNRALALAEREHAALGVAEHLDLDVAGRDERTLEVERSVSERGLGLRARGAVGGLEIRRRVDDAHPLAAAARGRLEQHREPELDGCDLDLGQARNAFGAGNERHPGSAHLGLGARLVARLLHHLGRRADEDEVALRARAHEGGVLREEAEARMDGLAARRLGGGDDVGDPQVALCRRGRADADRLVGHLDVERLALGGRVDGDRLDAELVERADHADRDLTPVRDEDAGEHRQDDRLGVGRLELEEQLAELDRLAALDVDRLDPALLLGLELVEELHRLEQAQRLADA